MRSLAQSRKVERKPRGTIGVAERVRARLAHRASRFVMKAALIPTPKPPPPSVRRECFGGNLSRLRAPRLKPLQLIDFEPLPDILDLFRSKLLRRRSRWAGNLAKELFQAGRHDHP